jgi:hypothetical protein
MVASAVAGEALTAGNGNFTMNLEDQLRDALRRRNPSVGFAERVAARAHSGYRVDPVRRFRGLWTASAVVLAAVVMFAATLLWRRAQEERAGHEAVLALRIASEKLNQVRSEVLWHTENQ